MPSECEKRFGYCGKLRVGVKGDGDAGDQLQSISSIDWATHVFNIGFGLPNSMLAVTGSGGTQIYQHFKQGDEGQSTDMEEGWRLVHHDPELIGNICRFVKTSSPSNAPGFLAVAVPTPPSRNGGEGAEVHMISYKKSAVQVQQTENLFKTVCFFQANLVDPTYEKKILDVCWGFDKAEYTLVILREQHPKIHSVRWVYGSRNVDGSNPQRYWFHESFNFETKPKDVDIYAAMSPVQNAFAACTKSSAIKIFRKGGTYSPAGVHHWYPAGQDWRKTEETGYISLAFGPSGTNSVATDVPLAGLKENGEVTLFSLESVPYIGNLELTVLCKLNPGESVDRPIYLAWSKQNIFWTCSKKLETLTLFYSESRNNWVSCSRRDKKNTGLPPFNLVSGLSCNPKNKSSVSWFVPQEFVLFAVNGNNCLRKKRELVDEKYIQGPEPSRQLIEYKSQLEDTMIVLKRLLEKAHSQSEDEHRRLSEVLHGLATLLGELYRGTFSTQADFDAVQISLEKMYEKGSKCWKASQE